MRVTIFGSGYVGLVTGACLAEVGNQVLCVDIDPDKIDRLNAGEVPIFEPGLKRMITHNCEAGRMVFTTDAEQGVAHGLFQMIAVGTPPDDDGSADLQHVLAVAQTIGEHIKDYRLVIDKSTVPVGTADKVREKIASVLAERGVEIEFDVVSNPEFLKEGAAIGDFMKPDRIIVGTSNGRATENIKALYEPFNRNHDRLHIMDVRSAELTKYAANAMLATKISFMNELANLAERLGADIEKVRIGIGSDPRIGYHFIYPGIGYGGSCFPKDVRALSFSAKEIGYQPDMLDSVQDHQAKNADRYPPGIRVLDFFQRFEMRGLRFHRQFLPEQDFQEEKNRNPGHEHQPTHVNEEGIEVDAGGRTDHQVGRITHQSGDAAGVRQQRRRQQEGNRVHLDGSADQDDQRAENNHRSHVIQQQRQHRDQRAQHGHQKEQPAFTVVGDPIRERLESAGGDHDRNDRHHPGKQEHDVPVDGFDRQRRVVKAIILADQNHQAGTAHGEFRPMKSMYGFGKYTDKSHCQDDARDRHGCTPCQWFNHFLHSRFSCWLLMQKRKVKKKRPNHNSRRAAQNWHSV